MAAVLALKKSLIFGCWKVEGGRTAAQVKVVRGKGAAAMLNNCSVLVDVADAQCAVPADKERELATIGPENLGQINKIVRGAVAAGCVAAGNNINEVDAFNCGERGPLRVLAAPHVPMALQAACAAGQLAVLMELQQAHGEAMAAHLAGTEDSWQSLVWAAAHDGHHAVVEWLVWEVGLAAEGVRPDGVSAMIVAAEFGHLEVVRVLAKAGASVDHMASDGCSPLFMAASYGHLEVARTLVTMGAKVNRAVPTGLASPSPGIHIGGATPLIQAAQVGHTDMVMMLIEEGASVDQAQDTGITPLLFAAQNGCLEVVRVLVGAGASVDQADNTGDAPLIQSAKNGHLEVVQELIKAGASVNQTSHDGCSPLWRAASKGQIEVLRMLAEAGADVEQVGVGGMTPLCAAAQFGYPGAVQVLLGLGATSAGQARDDDGATPLVLAAMGATQPASIYHHEVNPTDHCEVVRVLVGAGASVDQAAKDGTSPLLMAAKNGCLKVMKVLVAAGAAVDQADENGATALAMAAGLGHLQVVRTLVEAGADKSIKFQGPWQGSLTALTIAQARGHREVVDFLVNTPLCLAVQNGRSEEVLTLVEAGASVDQARDDGATPLIMAVEMGDLSMLRTLVESGATVDQAASPGPGRGITPLITAAARGNADVVRMLVEAGASIDQMKDDGATALFAAAQHGHLEVVRVLVEAGADKSVKFNEHTALSIAQLRGFQHVVNELVSRYHVRAPWTCAFT